MWVWAGGRNGEVVLAVAQRAWGLPPTALQVHSPYTRIHAPESLGGVREVAEPLELPLAPLGIVLLLSCGLP